MLNDSTKCDNRIKDNSKRAIFQNFQWLYVRWTGYIDTAGTMKSTGVLINISYDISIFSKLDTDTFSTDYFLFQYNNKKIC